MLPSWMGRDREDRNRRSAEHERRIARLSGGRVQAGSGSSWRAAEDVSTRTHLLQHKFTDKKGFRLTADEFLKVQRNAHQTGKEPAMVIDFDSYGLTLLVVVYPSADEG